jgi:hypothetical protein
LTLACCIALGCAEIRGEFQCHDDAACVRDGVAGVCEATGHCAFPDASCLVTRRRYGPHAGELSETCVVTGRYQWVATDGDDGAAGTEADPWRTLHFGVSQLGPGDALLVKPGIYEEALVDDIPAGESWERPFTLAAVPPRGATLRHETPTLAITAPTQRYIVIEGLVIDGLGTGDTGAVVVNQDHVEIRDGVVTGSPHAGIFLDAALPDEGGWNVVRGVEVHGNATALVGVPRCGTCDAAGTSCDCDEATGICTNATCAPNTNCPSCGDTGGVNVNSGHNLIEGCTIHDNEGAAIGLNGGESNVVRRNLITDLGSRGNAGIFVYAYEDPLIYDNVIHEPGATAAGIDVWGNGAGPRIFANTVVGATMIVRSTVRQAMVQNNIADAFEINDAAVMVTCSAGPLDAGDIGTVGPNCTNDEYSHFVDPLNGDFHLVPASPARNSGVPLPDVTIDFDGKPRPSGPAFDMGAFEYAE